MLHLLLSVLAVLVAISMVPTILSDPINQPIRDFTVTVYKLSEPFDVSTAVVQSG